MTEELIAILRVKAAELYQMCLDDDSLIRLNASKSPVWAEFARRRIALAREIDALLKEEL